MMKHKLNFADAITISRIVFAVLLYNVPSFSVKFYIFYLLGGFSDLIDGWIARMLKLKSSFGAKLDTVADFIFVIAVLIKVLPNLQMPIWLCFWIVMIAFIKLSNLVSSLVRFRLIVPMHTVMNKVSGIILFLLPLVFFKFSMQELIIVIIVISSIATFAAIQEGHYIRLGKIVE